MEDERQMMKMSMERSIKEGSTQKTKKISNILGLPKMEESYLSVNTVNKKIKYSYDHLEIYKKRSILEIIKQFQTMKNIRLCFSDTVYRLNSWAKKKKKWIVITSRYLFIFNSPEKLKKAIKLRNIAKINHCKDNNYIGICTTNLQEELLETFKKEEILLYITTKLRKLGKLLKLKEQKQEEFKSKQFNPKILSKFKPHNLETFSIASKNGHIGYITIGHKEFFGIVDTQKEMLALLTNYGILFFTSTNFTIIDFLPIGGCEVILPGNSDDPHFVIVLSDKSRRMLTFPSVWEKNEWYQRIQKHIDFLKSLNNSE